MLIYIILFAEVILTLQEARMDRELVVCKQSLVDRLTSSACHTAGQGSHRWIRSIRNRHLKNVWFLMLVFFSLLLFSREKKGSPFIPIAAYVSLLSPVSAFKEEKSIKHRIFFSNNKAEKKEIWASRNLA